MEKLFNIVNELALKEIELYGGPSLNHYHLALNKGEQVAKELNADVNVVKIGCALMDIKLGQCIKEGCQSEHVQKSYLYAKQILEQNNIDKKLKETLLDCVLSHHGTKNKKFNSLEAEICANVDCYRFIHPQGVFTYIQTVTNWGNAQNDAINSVLNRMEEKHNILSLDYCKKELENYYQTIKNLLQQAKI